MKQYSFDIKSNCWFRPGFDGIDYSDGQETEEHMLRIMSEASDCSVLSEELRSHIIDWPTEYHFSRLRHCLLRPLGIKAGDRVLELGCGCGAITRYLGETGADVVAVEGGIQRARIAAQRCRDLENVRVVQDNLVAFEIEEHFDWVLLIGVLEYAPLFVEADTQDPVQAYLESASTFLAEKGSLVVAIENQLGLKYFNGCGEDHVARPFFGIHDLYNNTTPVTFGKKELQQILLRAGLNSLDFLYPWPDYKLPSVILHSSAFTEPDLNLSDILLRCTSRDYIANSLRVFSEQFVMPVLERNGLLEDLANSFLVIARKEMQAISANRLSLAWLYSGSSRRKNVCTETIFSRTREQCIRVKKKRLVADTPEPVVLSGDCTVIHRCGSDRLHPGHLLVSEILRQRVDIESNLDLAKPFLPWFEEVWKLAYPVEGKPEKELESWLISGKYIDATPYNFIRSEKNELVLFDTEWEVAGDIPLGWLLYRAVIWSWFGTISSKSWQQERKISVYNILSAISMSCSLTVEADSLRQWKEDERLFQFIISGLPPGDISSFLPSVPENCFSYAAKQQQKIETFEAQVDSLQKQIDALYSSASWRYSRIVRLAELYHRKISTMLGKFV